jgi:hypothetical protein
MIMNTNWSNLYRFFIDKALFQPDKQLLLETISRVVVQEKNEM